MCASGKNDGEQVNDGSAKRAPPHGSRLYWQVYHAPQVLRAVTAGLRAVLLLAAVASASSFLACETEKAF